MSTRHSSLTRRALVQIDLAFWYLHAHFAQLAALAAPTLMAVFVVAAGLVSIMQVWSLPGFALRSLRDCRSDHCDVAGCLYAAAERRLCLAPRVRFAPRRRENAFDSAWSRLRQIGPRGRAAFLLLFSLVYLPWPAAVVFLAPQMRRRRRSHYLRMSGECFTVPQPTAEGRHRDPRVGPALSRHLSRDGPALFLPRIVVGLARPPRRKLDLALAGRQSVDCRGAGLAILISGVAVGWCISMTLLYREVRIVREGEFLRDKIEQMRREFLAAQPSEIRSAMNAYLVALVLSFVTFTCAAGWRPRAGGDSSAGRRAGRPGDGGRSPRF